MATVGASAPSEALASVLQALDVGVIIQDADLRITFANRRATELLGVSVDEITDRTTDDARWDVVTVDGGQVTGEATEHPVVLPGNPEYLGDNQHRQRIGELADQVGRLFAIAHLRGKPGRDLLDTCPLLLHLSRGEGQVRHSA